MGATPPPHTSVGGGTGAGVGRHGDRAYSSLKGMVRSKKRHRMHGHAAKIKKQVKERLGGREYF